MMQPIWGRGLILWALGVALAASAAAGVVLLGRPSLDVTGVVAAPAQSPTLAKVLQDGVLRVGIAETIPNAWKDTTTNEWKGYNVEVARHLASDLGVKLELIEAPLNSWIPQLQSGKFDIDMLGWFMTAKRAVEVDFTQPVFVKGYSMVVKTDSPVKSLEQLNDPKYTVTGVVGGSEEVVAKQYVPKAKPAFLNTNSPLNAALEVKAGRATAWIYPSDVIQAFLEQNSWARVLNPKPIWNNPLAYALRKGDPEWKFFLDAYITKVKESGDLARWIQEADREAYQAMSHK
jgi:polar amino acid transport system substrate-binding protein